MQPFKTSGSPQDQNPGVKPYYAEEQVVKSPPLRQEVAYWIPTERDIAQPEFPSHNDGTAYDLEEDGHSFFSTTITTQRTEPSTKAQATQSPAPESDRKSPVDPLEALMEKLRLQEQLISEQKDLLACKDLEVSELRQVLDTPADSVIKDKPFPFPPQSPERSLSAGLPNREVSNGAFPAQSDTLYGTCSSPGFSQHKPDYRISSGSRLGNVDEETSQDLNQSTMGPIGRRKESAGEGLNRPQSDPFKSTYDNFTRPTNNRHETWHSTSSRVDLDSAVMPPPSSTFNKHNIWGTSKRATPFYLQDYTYGAPTRQSSFSTNADYTYGQSGYRWTNPTGSEKSSPMSSYVDPNVFTTSAGSDHIGYGVSRRNSQYSNTSYGTNQMQGDYGNNGYTRNSAWDFDPNPSRSSAYVPIGTLSATAPEFTSSSSQMWNSSTPVPSSTTPPPTYISPVEPLDYRRLMERTVNCDWRYIVEKVVTSNDQQASMFLQQKLKVSTTEQKHAIIDAIVEWGYPLMINRFGNFLVQRCFEHGTQAQMDAVSVVINGKVLQLSMDAFGCHVVQKALDCVAEPVKATMVNELLHRIPETVVHRYACHVWQKLFELRWSGEPPQIMKFVNEALQGRWAQVALGETGSLVVQNIFENCLEEDKRPCINEILNDIDLIAHGQFGNWCIQHLCEHGAPQDRELAVNTVLQRAVEYSMDQFASKVVEKCLKVRGVDFLERYLERVCEGRSDRPRIPLIDIASDQYGNYLIQYILANTPPHHREIVATHIRKHMVSLRGSKFGSRVGMLCCGRGYSRPPTQHQAQNSPPNPHRYNGGGVNNGHRNNNSSWNYRNHSPHPPTPF